MPEDKEKADQNATRLAESLLGACARVGNTNPLQRTPLTGRFHIEGRVTRESGEPVTGISLGRAGQEAVTDEQGRFEITVEKK
jgi:hypothetical protein